MSPQGGIKKEKAHIKIQCKDGVLRISIITKNMWEGFLLTYPANTNISVALIQYLEELPKLKSLFINNYSHHILSKPLDIYYAGQVVLTINP